MSADSFSYSVKRATRKNGHNAVAHAAYIAGVALYDERFQCYQHFPGQDRVMATEIDIPENAPEWLRQIQEKGDRESLWNMAEAMDGNSKVQGAYRTVIMPIDDGLFVQKDGKIDREASIAFQKKMIAEHVREFTKMGMVADWAIHWDPGFKNPHAHVILTRRLAMQNGFHYLKDGAVERGNKNKRADRPWNDNHVEKWRSSWAKIQNKELEKLDLPYRVDHRSYKRRGIQLQPEHKHYGQSERKKANDRHHRKQSEQLIKNPRPIFDAISQSYVRSFTAKDLQRYAERFTKGAGLERGRQLYESLLNSKELIRLPGGLFLTQGLVAKQAREDLESTLKNYRDIDSWKSLDEAVKKAGWRLEIVSRETKQGRRLAFDFARRGDPFQRVSAYRVSTHFSPSKTRQKFGESRIRHELRTAHERRRVYYRAYRDRVWQQFKNRARLDREAFRAEFEGFRRHWEEHRPTAGPLSFSEKIAYRLSKWRWQRRRRKLEQKIAQAHEAAQRKSRAAQERERAATQKEAERKKQAWFGSEGEGERQRKATNQSARPRTEQCPKQKSAEKEKRRPFVSDQSVNFERYKKLFGEFQDLEATLDKMVLRGQANSKEGRKAFQKRNELGEKLLSQPQFHAALGRELGEDSLLLKGLRNYEKQSFRNRQADKRQGRGRGARFERERDRER